MKKAFSVILILAMVLSLATGCQGGTAPAKSSDSSSGDAAPADLPVVRVAGFDSRLGFNMWYIIDEGWDVENGFKLDLSTFNSGAPVNESIGAGLADVFQIGSPAGVNTTSVFGGIILGATSQGSGGLNLFARADSDIVASGPNAGNPNIIGNADAVRGATIMYPVGTMAQIGVGRYLDALGLSLDDATSVNMDYGSGYQAFKAGEGDICAVFSPLNYQALSDGYVKLGNLYDMNIPMYDLFGATKDYYAKEENRPIIKKILELLYKANDELNADRDLHLKKLDEYHRHHGAEIQEEYLPIELDTMYLITTEEAKKIDHGESLIATAEFYAQIGSIEEDKVQLVKDAIDLTLLHEILEGK